MATYSLSTCHFAELIDDITYKDEVIVCSFCGKPSESVPQTTHVGYDLELTLRRWKEGDCSTDDMLARLSGELSRVWYQPIPSAMKSLQKNGDYKFKFDPFVGYWIENKEKI